MNNLENLYIAAYENDKDDLKINVQLRANDLLSLASIAQESKVNIIQNLSLISGTTQETGFYEVEQLSNGKYLFIIDSFFGLFIQINSIDKSLESFDNIQIKFKNLSQGQIIKLYLPNISTKQGLVLFSHTDIDSNTDIPIIILNKDNYDEPKRDLFDYFIVFIQLNDLLSTNKNIIPQTKTISISNITTEFL